MLAQQLQATNDRFRVGEITRTDVAQAEAALAGATADRERALGELQIARSEFQRAVGFLPPSDLVEPQPLKLPVKTREDAAALARSNNPNVVGLFMEAKNLHALWDGGIVNAINPSGRALAKSLTGYIKLLSNSQRNEWSKGNAADWTWESHLLARRVIYERLHIPIEPVTFPKGCAAAPLEIREFRTVTDGLYINDMKPIVRDQLAKAGLRLAALLNQTFQ